MNLKKNTAIISTYTDSQNLTSDFHQCMKYVRAQNNLQRSVTMVAR